MAIPTKAEVMENINKLIIKEKEINLQLDKLLMEVRNLRKELEELESKKSSQWACYNRFYKSKS